MWTLKIFMSFTIFPFMKFKSEEKRYNELKLKGFVEEGKEVTSKK